MAPRKRVSTRRRLLEDVPRAPDHAGEAQQSTDSDSKSKAAEEGATPLVPPKKPKFTSPLKRPASEPVENGSACSSPSASGFVVVPSQKPRGQKKTKKTGKTSVSNKLFSDDEVISLLKGLAVFWANGQNSKWADFHLFVKDDLGNHFSKTQISEKVRTLKSKFERISKRARENGGRIDLSDPHESAVFELSKALWGDEKGIAPEKGQPSENVDQEKATEILAQKAENDERSKKKKNKNNKPKQVNEDEENQKMRKQDLGIEESVGEGDVRDAANTILSIRKLVDDDKGEGNKNLELADEHGEGNEKSKLVDENGEGNEKSKVEIGEGNKNTKPVAENENGEGNKKTKPVPENENGEGNKKTKPVPENENENDEGNKKSRKKKRKQGDGLDEKKELVNEGMHVGMHEEKENKISSTQKQINGVGERNKKMKKTKLVAECDEADKVAEKEVDEHAAKGGISKQVDQHNDEEENLLKEGKQVDDDEQQAKKIPIKSKQEGGHDVKKDLANQGKQVDDDFQCAYPLLYASFNTSEYPSAVMRNCVLIGQEKAEELEKKWRELKAEELRLELKRLDLMIGQAK